MRRLLLVSLCLTGCFYVSPGRHAEELDPDGDGVAWPDDCAPDDPQASTALELWADADGDGFGDPSTPFTSCGPRPGFVDNADDCDDADASTHPGADEVCDGLGGDEDCDGQVDEAGAVGAGTFWLDGDGDGWGGDEAVLACVVPEGASVRTGDCADDDPNRSPDAAEVCGGIDEDCDGLVDADDPDLVGTSIFYADSDADGFGDPAAPVDACEAPAGAVDNADDCDDTAAHVNPLGTEACDDDQVDEDCDGQRNESGVERPYYLDDDGDGYGRADMSIASCAVPAGYAALPTDCDDAHAGINPGATETCDPNDVDENCNELADDADDGPKIGTAYHPDLDADGFGDANTAGLVFCDSVPDDLVPDGSDCDDTTETIRPGADELCDGLDNDCDGLVDDDDAPVDPSDWYPDDDGDGFGAGVASAVQACDQPAGFAADATDCDDGDPDAYPGAAEVCGGGDDDCDGLVDLDDPDLVGTAVAYRDDDDDGFGGLEVASCGGPLPPGLVLDGGDCDDADPLVRPGATETCGPEDRDCDGDPFAGAVDTSAVFEDADGDGFGDPNSQLLACPGNGAADNGFDCDDNDAHVHPGVPERCGGGDEDCDGLVDDADPDLDDTLTVFYWDDDGDGYGGSIPVEACTAPAGTVTNSLDCLDADADVNPDGVEVCDPLDIDEDCDGSADDASATAASKVDYYSDLDGDGYGDAVAGQACAPPAGFVAIAGDCDDTVTTINPGAPELCDGGAIDEDCDGHIDDDDTDPIGGLVLWPDGDDDGFGDEGATGALYCVAPPGDWAEQGGDCDDATAAVNPGADELALDQVDSDCDGEDAVCGEAIRLVPTYYPSVLAAVTATCDGDEVHILPGTYPMNNVALETDITIRGTDPSDRPVLDGQGANRIFVSSGDVVLRDLNLVDGASANGGCIRQTGGFLDLDEIDFVGCVASQRGGAIWVHDATIDDTVFFGNEAQDGGALYLGSGKSVFVEDSLFFQNNAANGAGVVCEEGYLEVEQTDFRDNTADQFGGGVYAPACWDIEMNEVLFDSNHAGDLGGGMMIRYPDNLLGDANLYDLSFVQNTSVNEGAGLILLDTDTADIDFDGATFTENVAGGPGGGLYLENVYGTDLDDFTFIGNQAPDGAAIYAAGVSVDWDRTTCIGNSSGGTIVSIYDATADARALDEMEFEANDALDTTMLVHALDPIDIMRLDFGANPNLLGPNLVMLGPIDAYNVLSVNAAGAQIYVENSFGATARLVNSTIDDGPDIGVLVGGAGTLELLNTIVTDHATGVEVLPGNTVVPRFNNVFGNLTDWAGTTAPGGSNTSVDPQYIGGGDYHLASTSPLIDQGDPTLDDPDGSPSDPGYHGGPFAQ